jgi:pyrroline-5-carboxylate reductase
LTLKIAGKVAVIGVGTMGESILRGIRRSRLVPPSRLHGTVRTPQRAEELERKLGVRVGVDNLEAVRGARLVLLCLKPQDVLRQIRRFIGRDLVRPDQLFISIAAGVRLSEIEETLNYPCPVIRAMPNTPCEIGEGTTVLARGSNARMRHLRIAQAIFGSLGVTLELEERHFNTVTGLSGSGPAFGYLMVEALADGGVMMGLPRSVAIILAARTLLGAAEMVLATGKHPASLKDDVTTPAGCTIAGILALEDGRIRSTLARGVERAAMLAADLAHPLE